jgi:hypothetical protein
MAITRSLRSVHRADTRRIGETIPTPVHQSCPAGCDLAETTPDNRLLAPLSCPSCRHEHDAPVRVTVETSRRAANRPASPEIVHICPACRALLVLALRPAPREANPS